MHVEQLTYGFVTPVLAYLLSVLGSLAGLIATAKARTITESGRRARWLLLAAFAIGGTGIWVMHFVAMLGFSVAGISVRYDLAITFASWIIAVVVVAIGLFVVGFGKPNAVKIILAGIVTGVGVAGMHYTGMAAMRTSAAISYDHNLVIASVIIAIVAATVALWFTVTIRRGVALGVGAVIMGIAVSGMHYTGMLALRLSSNLQVRPVQGLLPVAFIGPVGVFVLAVILVLLGSLLSRPGDRADDRSFRLGKPATANAAPTSAPAPAKPAPTTPRPTAPPAQPAQPPAPLPSRTSGATTERAPGQRTSAAAFIRNKPGQTPENPAKR